DVRGGGGVAGGRDDGRARLGVGEYELSRVRGRAEPVDGWGGGGGGDGGPPGARGITGRHGHRAWFEQTGFGAPDQHLSSEQFWTGLGKLAKIQIQPSATLPRASSYMACCGCGC